MTGRTHDLTAFTALHMAFLATLPAFPSMTFATGITAFGATFIGGLTPDIDQPTADLWRRLPAGNIVGRLITPILGSHRMISHSILGIFVSGWLLRQLLNIAGQIVLVDMNIIWNAFMLGFLSHLFIDFFNRDGIPLFFPFPWKFGFPPVRAFRIKAGGLAEKTIVFPLLLLFNGYLIYANYPKYMEFLRLYIK